MHFYPHACHTRGGVGKRRGRCGVVLDCLPLQAVLLRHSQAFCFMLCQHYIPGTREGRCNHEKRRRTHAVRQHNRSRSRSRTRGSPRGASQYCYCTIHLTCVPQDERCAFEVFCVVTVQAMSCVCRQKWQAVLYAGGQGRGG